MYARMLWARQGERLGESALTGFPRVSSSIPPKIPLAGFTVPENWFDIVPAALLRIPVVIGRVFPHVIGTSRAPETACRWSDKSDVGGGIVRTCSGAHGRKGELVSELSLKVRDAAHHEVAQLRGVFLQEVQLDACW